MTESKIEMNPSETLQDSSVALIRVDRMYESLRYNDYSAQNGLGEIVDNSVEAGAAHVTVIVDVEKMRKPGKKKNTDQITEIAVVDDGCGMNRDTLHRCLALGESIRERSGKRGIGRFGVGMTLGGISLARRIEVYSRTRADEDFLYTFIDLDDIQQGNLIRIPEPAVQTPPQKVADLLKKTSGTVVILKKCDRIDGNVDFSNYLGQTYRKFIERGLEIKLNGEQVYLHDPLYMASPTIFDALRLRTEGAIEPKAISLGEFRLPREIPGTDGQTADVVIRMSLLPKEWRSTVGAGGSTDAKKRKIDRNEGISILRAEREVFYGHVPYITGKKGEARALEIDRWWGCEISFPPELDHDFQVRYIKRGAEPTADLRDQIRDVIGDVVQTARKMVQETWNVNRSEESRRSGNFGKAEEIMAKVGAILPKSKKGKNLTESEDEEQVDALASAALGSEKENAQKKEQKKAEIRKKPYSIEPVSYPKTILFDTVHLLNNTVIKLNVNHPFYKSILQPLCGDLSDSAVDHEHQDIKNAILLLLFAYAKAESMFDNHEELFETLRSQWGAALSAALSAYDREAHP
jgi:hypothetical protein